MKKTIALISFTMITAITSFYLYMDFSESDELLNCNSRVIINTTNKTLKVNLTFLFPKEKKATGIVTLNGTVYNNDAREIPIYRQVHFNYAIHNKGVVEFISTQVNLLNGDIADNDTIKDLLPKFYLETKQTITFEINKSSPNGLLFSRGKNALFYCWEK